MAERAKAPTRATNNMTLALGLVAVPIQIFKATEDTKAVERKMFSPGGNPIGYLSIDTVTKHVVPKSDVVYKVEVGDKWVELTEDEIGVATSGLDVSKHQVPIDALIPLESIGDKYIVDTSRLYQARPAPKEIDRKKVEDPMAVKAFALLLAALRKKKAAALFHVGLRSTARYAVLTPDGNVQFLFFEGELREERPMLDVEISDAEMDMALMLLGDVETPDFEDEAKAKIFEFLEAKAKDATATPVVADDVRPQAEVFDLMAALTASVEAKKAA